MSNLFRQAARHLQRTRDPFGVFKPFKRLIVTLCAVGSYGTFFVANHLEIEGRHHLDALDPHGVLFVMNHQTYFMDMVGFYWVVSSPNPLHNLPWIYFVADAKTMERNAITRHIFGLAGLVGIKRTWKEGDRYIQRDVDPNDQKAIGRALDDGWVITFPQGTTRPFAPVRRGTAHIIRQFKPVVIPVVISGFDQVFHKASLFPRKRGVTLRIRIKPPLTLDGTEEIDTITATIAEAIEQSESFQQDAPAAP
ncbi:MAG: lysophospholipid acyltransferase family protein [Myxococcota bacterium]